MIVDIAENAEGYRNLHADFARAFEFLKRPDLATLAPGKYEIAGKRVFAIVSNEHGRAEESALLETHEKYIDIQWVLDGTDTMGWKPKAACVSPAAAYDPSADLQFFADEPDTRLPVGKGMFAIFFPRDAHMPSISSDLIHKVIVKIAVS